MAKPNHPRLGRVVAAHWDAGTQSVKVEFEIEAPTPWRVCGVIYSGYDSTGTFIDPTALRQAVPQLYGLELRDMTGKLDPRTLRREDLGRLRIHVSLDHMTIGLASSDFGPDLNYFLNRFLR